MFRRKSTGIRIPLQQVLPAYRIVPTIVIETDIERIPDLSEGREWKANKKEKKKWNIKKYGVQHFSPINKKS